MNSSTLIVDFKGFVNRIGAPNAAPMPAFATEDNRERLANGFRLLRCRLRTDYEPAFVPTLGYCRMAGCSTLGEPSSGSLNLWNRSSGFVGVGALFALAVNGSHNVVIKEFPIARSGRRAQFRRWRSPEGHTNLP